MIPRYFFRSTIFNICYYILIAFSCVLLIPTLILPRKFFLGVVHYFVHATTFLERMILGLKYEVKGLEHLPDDNRYIIAAKHQSAYETTKLHILFKDPAIVLKRELLKIPLWGWYLAKSDQIAINRSTPKKAIESIKAEAKRVAVQNRPIVIFPQGTRVSPKTTPQERLYKVGIVRMQEATGLPIIPMALNTGTFYPRNAWIKRPGTITFEFLPPIEYIEGRNPDETLKKIEMSVEEASSRLRENAKQQRTKKKKTKIWPYALATIILAWTVNWHIAAYFTQNAISQTIADISRSPDFTDTQISTLKITGFPLKLKASIENITLITHQTRIHAQNLSAKSWPFFGMPIQITTSNIEIMQSLWPSPLTFSEFTANATYNKPKLDIHNAKLSHGETHAEISGALTEEQINKPIEINLNLSLKNHEQFIATLVQKTIIKAKAGLLTTLALNALKKDGIVTTTLTSQNNKLYLGLIKIYDLPPPNYKKVDIENIKRYETRRPTHLVDKRYIKPVDPDVTPAPRR